ncbi:MAG: hypothetical protein K6D02_05025 [Lachnospiraceae bacterium]|nr:hypothetical protein [Lachnospiraceae bacterium]
MFKKGFKKAMSVALAATLVLTAGIVAPKATKKAEAAKTYTAYLCLQTKKYNFRNNHDDAKFANYLKSKTNKKLGKGKFTNAKFKKGKVKFTVSLKGLKAGNISNDGGFNTLYIDTTLPGKKKSKLKITKAIVKMDGKKVATIKKPVLTPDPGKSDKWTQVMVINDYNKYAKAKYPASKLKKMPKKSLTVTIVGKLK